jgi:hypothetical protein
MRASTFPRLSLLPKHLHFYHLGSETKELSQWYTGNVPSQAFKQAKMFGSLRSIETFYIFHVRKITLGWHNAIFSPLILQSAVKDLRNNVFIKDVLILQTELLEAITDKRLIRNVLIL